MKKQMPSLGKDMKHLELSWSYCWEDNMHNVDDHPYFVGTIETELRHNFDPTIPVIKRDANICSPGR